MLSALWNLSAHSTENKAAICQVDGALGFLVSTLTYRCQGNSLAVIESGGGILRNVSSLIATREDYRSAPPHSPGGCRPGRGWTQTGSGTRSHCPVQLHPQHHLGYTHTTMLTKFTTPCPKLMNDIPH